MGSQVTNLNPRTFRQQLIGAALLENSINATAARESIAKGSLFAKLNNRYAMEMLQNLENLNAQKNRIGSPLSIASAFLMTLDGARGKTASEMCKTLCSHSG